MIYKLSISSELERLKYELDKAVKAKSLVEFKRISEQRSNRLNSALHLWFEMIAEDLNNAGLYMRLDFYSANAEVNWTAESIKEGIWRPIQIALTGKQSSAKLTNKEACSIIDEIIRFLGEKGITTPFPNRFWQYYEKDYLHNQK